MSAEDLGKRLLAEIEEETFDQMLATVRAIHDPGYNAKTGVGSIDRLIALFAGLQHERTHASTTEEETRNIPTTALKQKRSPPFIELGSHHAGDGKSHLAYYIIALAVLPAQISTVQIKGMNSAIVFIDAEGRFSVSRLVQIMRSLISKPMARTGRPERTTVSIQTEVSQTIETALQHIHIFRPQSMASLCSTVSSLSSYLFDRNQHPSNHKAIHSIILSSASTFYWSDRADTETANAINLTSPGIAQPPRVQSAYVDLASSIRKISAELSCPVIYTTFSNSAIAASTNSIRPSLPSPWPNMPTLRLIVQRRPVRKLPGAISGEEAVREAKDRNAAVEEGWFDVFVNDYGNEGWSQNVREGLESMHGGGFAMKILKDGVEVMDV